MVNNYNNSRNYKKSKDNEINKVNKKIGECTKLKEIPMKELVNKDDGYAYIIAKYSKDKKMKTNQLRKFFGAVRKIEGKNSWEDMEVQFYLLKPRMAASTGRNKIPKLFFKVISVAMDKVDVGTDDEKLENFKIFVEFFEAIVAYHKFLGGL